MKNTKYSEKQLQIISGELSLETVNGRTALSLYNKAIANGDYELADRAKFRLEQAKEEYKKKNRETARRNYYLRQAGLYEWKSPKTSDYTEHQKQIIRGEIPLDEVRSKDIVLIHQKAALNNDDVLAKTLFELIRYRRESAIKRHGKTKRRHNLCKFIETTDDFDADSKLSRWEQGVIKGLVEFDDYSEEDVLMIIYHLKQLDDKENLKIANQLLLYKQDLSVLYTTKEHWEAIDMLEELLQLPIRRPKSWFQEE